MSSRFVEFAPLDVPDFPLPMQDELGFASENLRVVAENTGQDTIYTLAHKRPLLGGLMHVMLESVSPNRKDHYIRMHASSNYDFGSEKRAHLRDEPGQRHVDEQMARHSRTGHLGRSAIGATFMNFLNDVRDEWVTALAYEELDSIYAPISRMEPYHNFSARVASAIDYWQGYDTTYRGEPMFDRRIGKIIDLLQSNGVDAIPEGFNRKLLWRDQGRQQYELFMEHLLTIPPDQLVDAIGKGISKNYTHGLGHHGGNRMVVDIANERFWYDRMRKYQPQRVAIDKWDYLFEMPDITFNSDGSLMLTDSAGYHATVGFSPADDPRLPSSLSIVDYTLPESVYRDGRYMTLAWRKDSDGNREFVDHAHVIELGTNPELGLQGAADSYLGKLLVRYFRQPGEYAESVSEMKWLGEMGLAGSRIKQKMTIRELPVWIQLPQHQQDLLNSRFITSVEAQVQ